MSELKTTGFATRKPVREGLIVGVVVGLLAGCGGTARQVYGEEEVLQASREEVPAWLGAPTCPADRVCATGSRTRAAAIEHARTDAHNDALKDFARRLESRAKARFQSARTEGRIPELGESGSVDQAVKDLYAAMSRVKLRDVHTADFWWRRVRSLGEDQRYHYYYDFHILLSVPRGAWARTVRDLVEAEKRRANAAGQQALVRELDAFAADLEATP